MNADAPFLALEEALRTAGVSVNEICRRASVDRSVWHRAKNGQGKLRPQTAGKLVAAVADLAPGAVTEAQFLAPPASPPSQDEAA